MSEIMFTNLNFTSSDCQDCILGVLIFCVCVCLSICSMCVPMRPTGYCYCISVVKLDDITESTKVYLTITKAMLSPV
jgi:hypothetical protein